MDIVTILREAVRLGASDIHMVANSPVMLRINGELIPMPGVPVFDTRTSTTMIYEILTEPQRAQFEKEWCVSTSFALETVRYRVSVALQRMGVEAVFRTIPNHIPTPDEIMLPPSVVRLAELNRGLILVTGPTGSGKSTTIASLIELINYTRQAKIVTFEDPIEFIYTPKKSFISQREIGQHIPNFEIAMRDILRQDPDVVLLGEMRDLETIAAAIQVADTGHLVLATLHAVDAPQAVERIIDVFPANQQQQIRTQLAAILRGVIAQTLLPRLDNRGRVAAYEVMMVTPGISTMIRQGRTHEIYSAIDMGSQDGMRSLNRSLQDLAKQGLIDPNFSPTVPPPNTTRPGPSQPYDGMDRRKVI